ncbi:MULTISPECIES: DUF3499 domain-containing protein [Actinomyces]|uniref:DUF3499 domain-containing protein n=3 Tax=Actinomyces TaxID=1654 RepID=A0ABN6K5S0_9ACTO|nr:DUF3499 domain-containing protein [Actinomyces capricornis]BDA63663.1 hypothetical protein MANAM107_04970 [Actinomyces capricornis]
MATLTSVYADSTIVLGPLATEAQPEAYDLCEKHVASFTAPRGWQIIRLATEFAPAPPSEDDLLALADAVREASRTPRPAPQPAEHRPRPGGIVPAPLTGPASGPGQGGLPQPPEVLASEITRRGHLRVLRGDRAVEEE